MFARVLVAVLAGVFLAVPAAAQNPPEKADKVPGPTGVKPDPGLVRLISLLHEQKVTFEGSVNDVPLLELLNQLSKKYDIPFVVNSEAFKAADTPNILDTKPNLAATQIQGVVLHRFLAAVLDSMKAAYLVRNDYVEITTPAAARKESGAGKKGGSDEPLVSVAVEAKPLATILTDLARVYELNIVIDHQCREDVKTLLTERLLNVPADTALELLAGQAGLAVVRKGNTFRVTRSAR